MVAQKLADEGNVFLSLGRSKLVQIQKHTCIRYIVYVIVMITVIETERTFGDTIYVTLVW